MATHDYVIANGTGAAVRSDLNGALAAIVSNNSSASEPAPTYAYMWWADTSAGLLKQRNAANSAWITIGTLASTNLGLLSLAGGTLTGALLADDSGTVALPAIAFDGDPNTGIFRPGADQLAIATNGVERVDFGNTEVVFNDDGADVDFRVEGDTNANLFKIDAGLDEVQVANLNGGQLAGTRNRIINGDMRIWQRGTTFTNVGTSTYTADRFSTTSVGVNFTVTRDTDVPNAQFKYSLKAVPASSTTPTEAAMRQQIEQLNMYDFAGQSVTTSAWVKCSKSQVKLRLGSLNNTGGTDSTQTVNVTAGTWTKISYTHTNFLTTTAWTATPTDAGGYVDIGFVDSTLVSTSDYIFVTGVQVEPGTIATPFERRSYGQELALCQRYYSTLNPVVLVRLGNTETYGGGLSNFTFSQTMRAAPSVTRSVNGGNYDAPVFDVGTSGGYMYYGSGTNVGDYINLFLRFSAEL